MKPHPKNVFHLGLSRLGIFAGSMAFIFATSGLQAATYYWDGGTTNIAGNGNGASNPSVNGNWNTTVANFDQSGVPYVAWQNTGGPHTAVFGGAATRTVTVSGTLEVGKLDIQFGTGPGGYTFTGGTLNFTNGIIEVNAVSSSSLANAISSTLSGSLVFNATGNVSTTANFIQTISGTNTGLTSFELNAGANSNQLGINNIAALGANGATVKLTKGIIGLSVAGGGTYNSWTTELAGGTIRARVAGNSTYSGNSTLSANSALSVANIATANLLYTGTINLNSHTLSLAAGNAGAGIAINNTISGSGNITLVGNATDFGASAVGTVTLGAANTFSGTATNSSTGSGVLALGHVNALQNATLNTGASGLPSVTFTVAGTNTYNIGALEGLDELAIGANTISVGSKAVDTTFGAIISGTGGSFTKVGSAVQTLSGTNTYTGATTINAGTLRAGAAAGGQAFGNGSAVSLANVASATLDLNGFSQTIGSLAGGGATGGNVVLGNNATLTAGGDNANTTYAGVISGTGTSGLTKTGSGALIITGVNTYTGTTTVSNGTLAVNGSLDSAEVSVANGAILRGSGSIDGSVTVNGTLAVGNSIESLAMGALTLNGTSTFAYEIQTNLYAGSPNLSADLADSSGTLDIASGAILTITDLAASTALAPNSKLTLISYMGGWTSGELFTYLGNTLADNSIFTLGSNQWLFDYNDTTGGVNYSADQSGASRFVTMTVIPETSTALLSGFGALVLLRRRRS